MRRFTFMCLYLYVSAVSAEGNEPVWKLVDTTQGTVRGYKDTEHGIFSFQNIPYATAPTGPNKFKAPKPPPIWRQTLDAIDKGIICPQPPLLETVASNKSMQEDCLIANVYAPATQQQNLAVVVYVHGGGYQFGWGNMLVQKKLVSEHNIILINFNYRLGAHGFLCLGTDDAPGNAGMKDQLELLRWVKKNIANFGGNPNDVTIAGYSAGSSSVDLLMLSKSAEGFFNKVIPESGVSTSVFTVQYEPLENAKRFAEANNFTIVDDVHALEQFYKTASYEVLTKDPFLTSPDSTYVFAPCIERPSKGSFMDKSPVNILKSGTYKRVPVLYGFDNMEGLYRIDLFETWKIKMNENFSTFLPSDLSFESEEQRETVTKKVKEFYFGDKPVNDDNILAYVDYFTDIKFAYSTLRSVKLIVENGNDQVYLYEYSFVDKNTPNVPHTNVKGANHCAQTNAISEVFISHPILATKFTEEFKKVSSKMRQMWANFIKTGKPVPEGSPLPKWPAVRGEWAPHMSIGSSLKLRGSLLERRARFWEDIYAKHYRNPLPPPTPSTKPAED